MLDKTKGTGEYHLAGKQTILFEKNGVLVTRKWATLDERSALFDEMIAAGMTLKRVAREFRLSPRTVAADLLRRKLTVFDLRSPKGDSVRIYVPPAVDAAIQEFAKSQEMSRSVAAHTLVMAGLNALTPQETTDA